MAGPDDGERLAVLENQTETLERELRAMEARYSTVLQRQTEFALAVARLEERFIRWQGGQILLSIVSGIAAVIGGRLP